MPNIENILLVSPDSDNESLWITGEEERQGRVCNNMVPLGLATVAALTPPQIHVDIWDELVHGRIERNTRLARHYDLVGITGYKVHMPRCREIAAVFRQRGVPAAIGGPGVSGTPDAYRGDFDLLFVGEAEQIWPAFLADYARDRHRPEYHQIVKPELTDSPLPRWDSLRGDLNKYAMGCVQTTRGCPFDCEFCDVISLFGRRARHKPIDRVLREIRVLADLGVSSIFFSDDEFIGDPRYAKALLRDLIPLNNSLARPLTYAAQASMNLSRDDELLELMADANVSLVFIGIETPNQASLLETNKRQNLRADLVGDVHKILSYGLVVRAGLMVGFDHDDASIFDNQYAFIQEACLPSVAINMLKAPLETRLWARLRREGRVVTLAQVKHLLGHARSYTNVIPKLMSRVELMRGYRNLLTRAHAWQAFAARMRGFVSLVRRRPQVVEEPLDAEQARRLCLLHCTGDQERRVATEIIDHTARVAPFMLRRVKTAIVQFAQYRETLAGLLPQIDRQIELEETGSFPLEPDDRPIVIPEAFRGAYRQLFPEVHRRVCENLSEQAELPQALAEVFTDFLVRWGESFQGPAPQHAAALQEITDRTCAKFNGRTPPPSAPGAPIDLSPSQARRLRLADDILKSVERELLKYEATRSSR